MRPPGWLIAVLAGAALGLVFAGVSTYDFVQHLDRQVHSLHCSFIPGGGHSTGASGCQAAMMSSYSSLFRTHVWGGIPISLPAMAVFGFILFYAADLLVTKRTEDPRATAFLALACALPAATSLIMLAISLTKLGTVCKLCVAIYTASAICLASAVMLWRRARGGEVTVTPQFLGGMFAAGVAFVAVPVVTYLMIAPDHGRFIGTCDGLVKPEDPSGVIVDVHRTSPHNAQAIEILDPLCPACQAFETRLLASGFDNKLDRRAVLFPLDNSCNWMVTETTHPGACTVSEAVLCAGPKAPEVIKWAFQVQDRIRAEAKADPAAAARIVKQRFPELAACIGSPEAKAKLNKSLRWSVANNIHVLTPQLFIDGVKLCDEDVDLGLEYALNIMLDRHAAGTLHPAVVAPVAPVAPPADMPKHDTSADKAIDKAADKPADKPVTSPTEVKPEPGHEAKPEAKPETKPDTTEPKPETKPDPKPEPKPEAKDPMPQETPPAAGSAGGAP